MTIDRCMHGLTTNPWGSGPCHCPKCCPTYPAPTTTPTTPPLPDAEPDQGVGGSGSLAHDMPVDSTGSQPSPPEGGHPITYGVEVPVRLGAGGPVVGSAVVHDGFATVTITDDVTARAIAPPTSGLSIGFHSLGEPVESSSWGDDPQEGTQTARERPSGPGVAR